MEFEGLIQATVQGSEVGDDARLVAVDDLEGLDLQQETGEEVPNAVVDLAGDPRSLGQGGGTRLVVLRLEQPGVRVLQGEDLLAQVVPRGVQGRPCGLLLVSAQREEGRERADDEVEHRLFRRPPGHGHEERRAADRRDGPLPPSPECGEAGQVVDGQRRPGHGGRRESPEQEINDRGDDDPAPLVGDHVQPTDGRSREQPDHHERVRPPREQGQQDAAAQERAFIDQDLHASIIGDPRTRPPFSVLSPPAAHDRCHARALGP